MHTGFKGFCKGVFDKRESGGVIDLYAAYVDRQLLAADYTELKELISRLELEKRYRDLSKSEEQVRSAKGRDFVADVLEKSGKNIATQFTTYMMGTAVNKLAGSEIVNPKKGQKDK